MQISIFNFSSLNHETNFKLILLFLKHFIRNMQTLQNPNLAYHKHFTLINRRTILKLLSNYNFRSNIN